MKHSKLLSIIIPCYNGEKWLPIVMESIFCSDLPQEDIEIILINDASEDNTLAVMREIEATHDNLVVVSLENRSFWGGARNKGLIAASGEYVWFVDSDDIIAQKGCEKALQKAINENVDVLGFEYSLINQQGAFLRQTKSFCNYYTQSGLSFAKNAFIDKISMHLGYVWRFFYRRRYLLETNIVFAEGVCWEDTVFMPKAIIGAARVCAIESVLYKYRQNPDSISGIMHRQYPARLLYEYAFLTGKELLDYAMSVKDQQLSQELCETAIDKYINGFLVFLLRTTYKERSDFYREIRKDGGMMKEIKPYLYTKNAILISPYFGRIIVELLASLYKYKHMR